jgi:hypothetical protein
MTSFDGHIAAQWNQTVSGVFLKGRPLNEDTPMKKLLLAVTLVGASSLGAFAQTTTTANPDGDMPAIASPDSTNATAPVEGQNSFTEDQAKERIADAGYTGLSGLTIDDKGVWHGTAMKDGKPVSVALDYQGNIVAN